MSARYQQIFNVPEGFPGLLKGFAREVLRVQPENIYEFGATYFANLVEEREAALNQAEGAEVYAGIDFTDPAAMQELILNSFLEADTDGSGFLNRKEFVKCLRSVNLGLSKKDILQIMEAADEDGDGFITYSEFVPVATELLQVIRAKAKAEEEAMARDAMLAEQAEDILVRGMSQQQLEGVMKEVFRRADSNGNGVLSRSEFKTALSSADLGLTRKDINILLTLADENEDGSIDYNEFVPVCYGILVEKLKRELAETNVYDTLDSLGLSLMDELSRYDETGEGKLSKKGLKRAMKEISRELLGLTRIQMASLLSLPEACASEGGLISLAAFVPAAASAIHGIMSVDKARQRAEAMAKFAQTDSARIMARFDRDAIQRILVDAFIEHDKDNSGALDPEEAEALLRSAGVEQLGLRPREIEALLAAMDEDSDGLIYYDELQNFMIQVLENIALEDAIAEEALY